jgi:hypothetical protein
MESDSCAVRKRFCAGAEIIAKMSIDCDKTSENESENL